LAKIARLLAGIVDVWLMAFSYLDVGRRLGDLLISPERLTPDAIEVDWAALPASSS